MLRLLLCLINNQILFAKVPPQISQCSHLVYFQAWREDYSPDHSYQTLHALVYQWADGLHGQQHELCTVSRIEQYWGSCTLLRQAGAWVGPRVRQSVRTGLVSVELGRKCLWGHQRACLLHTAVLSHLAWSNCSHPWQPYIHVQLERIIIPS